MPEPGRLCRTPAHAKIMGIYYFRNVSLFLYLSLKIQPHYIDIGIFINPKSMVIDFPAKLSTGKNEVDKK